jgi:hypothetical protein
VFERGSSVIVEAVNVWNQTPAPKDRPIVAIGGVMTSDEWSTAKIPFCEAIEWSAEHEDWMLYHDSPLCLRRGLDEEVVIHYWVDYPTSKISAGLKEVAA